MLTQSSHITLGLSRKFTAHVDGEAVALVEREDERSGPADADDARLHSSNANGTGTEAVNAWLTAGLDGPTATAPVASHQPQAGGPASADAVHDQVSDGFDGGLMAARGALEAWVAAGLEGRPTASEPVLLHQPQAASSMSADTAFEELSRRGWRRVLALPPAEAMRPEPPASESTAPEPQAASPVSPDAAPEPMDSQPNGSAGGGAREGDPVVEAWMAVGLDGRAESAMTPPSQPLNPVATDQTGDRAAEAWFANIDDELRAAGPASTHESQASALAALLVQLDQVDEDVLARVQAAAGQQHE